MLFGVFRRGEKFDGCPEYAESCEPLSIAKLPPTSPCFFWSDGPATEFSHFPGRPRKVSRFAHEKR
ncbi:MAG: hypothetical protein AW06_001343 [Candidatus Accumulibacter cognatus]|uniref:Uncharacterized protein n=1 Tax=Candidatus Accumulibacter cognatus TaxID=2954383 RepID=A0A080MK05_9PROT|nr:MAG: hypothetical protein AW06_001343 [Candidatus Accumulibacter cognatus]